VSSRNIDFGKAAEEAAVYFLKTKHYRILERNYKTKLGEIDIIAQQGSVICFIEVKARHTLNQGSPQEAVSIGKQRQICRAAVYYLKSRRLLEQAARFDVVALLYENNQPKITLIQDAFELSSNITI